MFGIGMPEMILILALALIVVGPDKLPDLARSLAKGILELKNTAQTLKNNITQESPVLKEIAPEIEDAAKTIKNQLANSIDDDQSTSGPAEIFDDLQNQDKADLDGTKESTPAENLDHSDSEKAAPSNKDEQGDQVVSEKKSHGEKSDISVNHGEDAELTQESNKKEVAAQSDEDDDTNKEKSS